MLTAVLTTGLLIIMLTTGTLSCGGEVTPTEAPDKTMTLLTPIVEGGEEMAFNMTSAAFVSGQSIPSKYTCDGENISPPLEWADQPRGTASFALISDDPDAPAGTWVHWVIYNLPSGTYTLPESVPTGAELADGTLNGKNSWGRLGYGGPCPPGGTHRYFFKLYALDTMLNLGSGATKEKVLNAMEGHILAQAELMGTYSRR